MMGDNMINLGINEDMVKPILEKQIQAAIIANIGNPEELIGKVVSHALNQKVDKEGNTSRYSSDNKFDYLDILTTNYIRSAAKESLQEWLKENSKVVREMVKKEMNKPERQRTMVNAFADAVESSLKMNWRFNCDIKFYEMED